MHTSSILSWLSLVALCIVPLTASAEDANRYQSDAFGYSIVVPEGWKEVPRDVIEEQLPGAADENTPYVYDAVFDNGDGAHFDDAYMTVHVTPYTALLEDGQSEPSAEDIRALLERKSSVNKVQVATDEPPLAQRVDLAAKSLWISHYDPKSRTYTSAIDIPVRRSGNMRGQTYGIFGDNVLVEVTMFMPSKRWDDVRPLYLETIESFAFDARSRHDNGLWNKLPPLGRYAGLALFVLFAIIGALRLWTSRRTE